MYSIIRFGEITEKIFPSKSIRTNKRDRDICISFSSVFSDKIALKLRKVCHLRGDEDNDQISLHTEWVCGLDFSQSRSGNIYRTIYMSTNIVSLKPSNLYMSTNVK